MRGSDFQRKAGRGRNRTAPAITSGRRERGDERGSENRVRGARPNGREIGQGRMGGERNALIVIRHVNLGSDTYSLLRTFSGHRTQAVCNLTCLWTGDIAVGDLGFVRVLLTSVTCGSLRERLLFIHSLCALSGSK